MSLPLTLKRPPGVNALQEVFLRGCGVGHGRWAVRVFLRGCDVGHGRWAVRVFLRVVVWGTGGGL
jgi:hypothetical protein